MAQSCTTFGAYLINNYRAMDDYLCKKADCCHVYSVNCLWEKLYNQYMYRLTIIAQIFCGLKEILLTAIELQGKLE